METLKLPVRGEAKRTVDYGTRTITFEGGTKQKQRLWVNPRVTFTVNCEGGEDMRKYLVAFFDAVHGDYDKFYWTYEGTTMTCRFTDPKVEFTEIREYGTGNTVGYRATVNIEVAKSSE